MRTTGVPQQESPSPHRSGVPRPPLDRFSRAFSGFLKTRNPGVALLRDFVVVVLIIVVVLGGLWAYSGQALDQPPLVVVESGSMMHPDAPFGRIGTIDPGDLVLIKRTLEPESLPTAYEGPGHTSYGGYGSVVVFRPMGDEERTPIIHRILTWVEAVPTEEEGVYLYDYVDKSGDTVRGARSVDLPEVGIVDIRPTTSGFITKGDNPFTNHAADQVTHLPGHLVEPEWILGQARGQAPWLGLVKLAITGNDAPMDPTGQCKVLRAWAPCDTWLMLGASAGVLFVVPVGLEVLWKHNATLRRWAS